MHRVKITAKRQATLPSSLCRELGVGPGHTLVVEPRTTNGKTQWLIRGRLPDWSWFGAARRYAKGRAAKWPAVKRSIARGWAGDARP